MTPSFHTFEELIAFRDRQRDLLTEGKITRREFGTRVRRACKEFNKILGAQRAAAAMAEQRGEHA